MEQYIKKSALVAEIEKYISNYKGILNKIDKSSDDWVDSTLMLESKIDVLQHILSFLDTLEVKEVDEQKERMSECPYRKVGCTMYEGTILECNGACSWVVDYQRLKELKAQKGE